MTDIARLREATTRRVLDGDGHAPRDLRKAAYDNVGLTDPARSLIDKVARHASQITDEDVVAAKGKLAEDELFELAVCAALGQATRQLESALAALDEVQS